MASHKILNAECIPLMYLYDIRYLKNQYAHKLYVKKFQHAVEQIYTASQKSATNIIFFRSTRNGKTEAV